jgi:hypothetical protein
MSTKGKENKMIVHIMPDGSVKTGANSGAVGSLRYRLGRMSKRFYQSLKDRGFRGIEVKVVETTADTKMFGVKITATGQSELAIGHLDDNVGARMSDVLKEVKV